MNDENNNLNSNIDNISDINKYSKNKKKYCVLIIILLVFFSVGGYILYDYYNKTKVVSNSKVNEVNSNNTVIDDNNNKDNNKANNVVEEGNTISNDENNNSANNESNIKVQKENSSDSLRLLSHEALIITNLKQEGIVFNYNYLEDYNYKYELACAIAREELQWEDKTINDEDATGGFKVNLVDFSNLYKKLFNEEFNANNLINDLNKYPLIHYPVIKNGYLYGGYVTGMMMCNSMDYNYVKTIYDEQSDVYELVYDAVYINCNLETRSVENIGTLKYKLKINDDDSKQFISMIIEK